MKKITLLIFMSLLSFVGYSQVFPEGFEGVFPPTSASGTWAVTHNGVGTGPSDTNLWVRSGPNSATSPPHTGQYAASVERINVGMGVTEEDWLISPKVTVPANGQLRFYAQQGRAGDQGSKLQIRVSTIVTAGTQTTLANFTTQIVELTEPQISPNAGVYAEQVINLTPLVAANQEVYIAFVRVYTQPTAAVGGDRFIIDDINLVQQCLDPTNGVANAITTSTATLSWTNPSGSTNWEIEVVPSASPLTGVGTAITTNPYNAINLTPGTVYQYRVRSKCTGGPTDVFSNWAGPFYFTTNSLGQTCAAPIVINSLPYSTTDNTANYGNHITTSQGTTGCGTTTNYMTGNDVVYAYTAATTGIIDISMTPTATYSGIFVYNNCANIGTSCLAGVGNSGTTVRNITNFAVTAGTTYYFVISTNSTPVSTGYTLVIQQVNCAPPGALAVSGITMTQANLSWSNPSSATEWQVVVQALGAGIPTGTGTTVTGTPAYTATTTVTGTPLASGTDYEYYVRAKCADGSFSQWSGPKPFKTLPNYCGGDHFFDTGGLNGDYANNENVTTTICPVNPTDMVTVTFNNFNTESGYDFLRVYQGTGTAGTLLGTYSGALTGANLPGPFESAPGACLTFVFTSDGSGIRPGWDATVTCAAPPTCPKPTTVNVTNPTMNSAQVSWVETGTATSWEVMAVPAGTPSPNTNPIPGTAITAITNTPSPYVLNGLSSATSYDFYVRAICSPTDKSTWSGPRTTKTLPNYCAGDHFYDTGGASGDYSNSENVTTVICPVNPTDIVTVQFNSFNTEANYDFLRVYEGNGTTGTLLGTFTGDLTANLPGPFESATPGACLTFVFTSDGSAVRAGWDATVTCGPVPTCPKPKNLTATGITQTTANLGWTEMGTATQWEVIVLPAGSPAPLPGATGTIVNTPPPYTYGPLAPGTQFDFYVRAICSASDISAWSIKGTFATLIANDECANAIHVPVNEDSLCGQTTPGTLIGATASTTPNTCTGGTPDDDVWFEFTATHTQHYIALLNTTSTGLNAANLYHTVYQGDQCGNLTQLYCSDPNNSLANNLVPGQTYKIRVYSNASGPQNITFNLCVGTVITCADAQAFCANNTSPSITFPGSIGVPNLGNVACLSTTPNPTWYFLQVQQSGSLNFQISQTSTTGAGIDVDFIAYGPFTSPTAACTNLGSNVGCSYSTASVENFSINNAVAGQYYMVMITNFNGSAGNITFAQTNQGQPGAGSTNCDIVCTVDLGPDKILCGATSYTLDSGIVNATTYTWSKGGFVIPGATGQTLTVTESGEYTVVVTKPSCSNNPTDSVNITFGPSVTATSPPDYKVCDDVSNDGIADFDLSTLTSQVLAGLNTSFTYNVSYHATLADANGNIAPISSTTPFTSASQTIYIRVEGANAATCFGVVPVNLVVKPSPTTTMPATYSTCGTPVTIVGTPTNYNVADATYVWSLGGNVIAGETSNQITVSQAGTYTLEVTLNGCVNTVQTVLTNDNVTVTAPNDATACNSYTLPALTIGNYYTGSGGTGTMLNAGDLITTTQTIYVYLQSTTNPSCTAEDSFDVTITTTITAPVIPNQTVCNSYLLQPLPSYANYYTGTGGTGTMLTAGSSVTTSQTIYVYAKSGTAPNFCTDESSFIVTIQTATADAPANTSACGTYVLPALSANNNYYTGTGGTGTMYVAGNNINATTTLYVYTQTSAGCTAENSFTITIYNAPQAATLPNVTVECGGFTLPALPAGNVYYTGPNATGSQLTAGSIVSITQTIYIYAVTGSGATICSDESSFEVTTSCIIPKGISPNGDGLNDTFDLSTFDVEKLSIFNRYGTEVFKHGAGYTNQWFGQSNGGNELPDGTYFYVIELKGSETKTGWIYINREK